MTGNAEAVLSELRRISDDLDRVAIEQERLYGLRIEALLRGKDERLTSVTMADAARLSDVTVRQTLRRAREAG